MKILNEPRQDPARADNPQLSTEDSSPIVCAEALISGHKGIVKFKQIFDTPVYTVIEMEYI